MSFPSPGLKSTGKFHCLPLGILLLGRPKLPCKKSDYPAGKMPWRMPHEEKALWSIERGRWIRPHGSSDLADPRFPAIPTTMSDIWGTIMDIPSQSSPHDGSSSQHHVGQKSHRATTKTEICILCKQKNSRNRKISNYKEKNPKQAIIPKQGISSVNILYFF